MKHNFEELCHDVIAHIFEYYSIRLFRYAHLILSGNNNDNFPSTKQLHPSMIKLLYGYHKHDANRRITLLFSTVDLSGGFIYNAKAQEVELTDQIVYQMVPFKSIRGINISDCDRLTQSVLEPLQFNMKLKYLSIDGLRLNDDSFVRYIGNCKNLESLDISDVDVSSQTMELLSGPDRRFPYLTKLDMSLFGDENSCVDMAPLFDNHRLTSLSLCATSFKSDTYDRIFSSRTLRNMVIFNDYKMSQEVLRNGIQASTIPKITLIDSIRRLECQEQLAENEYLTELKLTLREAKPKKFQAIWRSKSLKRFTLILEREKPTGKKQPYLKGIENNSTLESLKLMRCSFYDLAPLTRNQSLVDLSLIRCSVTDQFLILLARSKSRLTALNLYNNYLTEKCIETIMQLQLELLNIGSNTLSPAFAITLASHPTLKTLRIRNAEIRNTGARALLQNPSITYLDIGENHLSDECFDNGLELCPSLTRLDVRENRLSNIAAKVIFESRGLIDVDLRSNNVGYLGVKSIEHNSSIRYLHLGSNPMNSDAKILLLNHPTLLTISMN